MKSTQRIGAVLCLLAVLGLACDSQQRVPTQSPRAEASASETPSQSEGAKESEPVQVGRALKKKDGWFRFDQDKVAVKTGATEVEDTKGVFYTKFKPKAAEVLELQCDKAYKDAICERYPFDTKWTVNEIIVFKKKDRPFCYKVVAERTGSGAIQIFAFFDDDGDGAFESFASDASEFHVPTWLK